MLNKVILIGYLGRDPEMRDTRNDTKVCNLSVATSTRYKGEDQTEWHRVVAFGQTAEFCGNYLTKGRLVAVEGRMQYGSYEKDGIKRYTADVVASRIQALDKKQVDQSTGTAVNGAAANVQDETAEDIPF